MAKSRSIAYWQHQIMSLDNFTWLSEEEKAEFEASYRREIEKIREHRAKQKAGRRPSRQDDLLAQRVAAAERRIAKRQEQILYLESQIRFGRAAEYNWNLLTANKEKNDEDRKKIKKWKKDHADRIERLGL